VDREPADRNPDVRTAALVVVAAIAVITALYFGRTFLVPIAFAMLLNAVFRPVVRGMQRLRIPAPVGATLVVLSLIGLMVAGGLLLQAPMHRWFTQLPQTFDQARAKLQRITQPVQKAAAVARQVERSARDLGSATQPSSQPASQPGGQPAAPAGAGNGTAAASHDQPPQEVTPAPPGLLSDVLGTTTALLGGTLEVLVLLLLILAGGGAFRKKLVAAVRGPERKARAERVVQESHAVVLRYLLVTAIINVVQGVLVGLLMWWLGMPSPVLWGLFTFVLEFVPYLGATVMIVLLTIVGLATLDGVWHAALPPLGYLLITNVQNNIVSPLAYGHGLKLNPVVILIAVLFWWFIWGTPGAFLAVPILAVAKVVADNSRRLKPLSEFLGE
jgi:predicted PurR-regulated permease PerM